MPKRTFYEVLGVDRQAPAAAIKSQYRRLAKRSHPDLNPNDPQAARQFQEVQAAYEVLSDPERRQAYDTDSGFEPLETGNRRPWQNGSRTYRRYDGRPRQRPRATRPVSRPSQPRSAYSHYTIELTLQELFRGVRRPLVVGQTFTCGRCRGKGKLESGGVCERCGGYGFVVNYQRVEVLVPPGLQPGMNIRLDITSGQPEHPLLDAPVSNDIAVTICLRETPPFEYRDHQLYATAHVPAHLLSDGGEWTIPAPEGGEITFKIPPATLSGSVLTLRKRGLRNGSSQRRGNLLCTLLAQP